MAVILKRGTGSLSAAVLFFLSSLTAFSQQPQMEFDGSEVYVRDLDKEVLYTFARYYNSADVWREVFPVFVEEYGDKTSIDGEYVVTERTVKFKPRFPFAAGVQYKAVFHYSQLTSNRNEVYLPQVPPADLAIKFVSTPARPQRDPDVVAIYPSGNSLPENLLKVHIRFNTPMTYGEAYQRISLLDEAGREIQKAFLVVDQEMWDDSLTLLTLTFDPGRVKRGLRPNREMGTALEAGKKYSIVVASGWKNIDGKKTSRSFTKTFTCIQADRSAPDPTTWKIKSPTSANDPLVMSASESFDAILLSDGVRVTDSNGHNIRGTIRMMANESGIMFFPELPWEEGDFDLHINPKLEDLAGNNLNRLFDRDLTEDQKGNPPSTRSFTVSFRVTAN